MASAIRKAADIIKSAVNWIRKIAADNSHGYDQGNRWGPDYDCSSLVISAYKQAGVPLTSTYTGNMKADFLRNGFTDVTGIVNLFTGAGLETGDVLLNEKKHTAMYIGNGMIAHASGNESGGITGGRTGDQTGREITEAWYYNAPWDCVLRYGADMKQEEDKTPATGDGGYEEQYIVQAGDSLWAIADRFLGDGSLFPLLMQYNGLKSSTIRRGDVLYIPKPNAEPDEPSAPSAPEVPAEDVAESFEVKCLHLEQGDYGECVRRAQILLLGIGYSLPQYGADGDYGSETAGAVAEFQADNEIREKGIGPKTYRALLGY